MISNKRCNGLSIKHTNLCKRVLSCIFDRAWICSRSSFANAYVSHGSRGVIVRTALHETYYCKPSPIKSLFALLICLIYYYSLFVLTHKEVYIYFIYLTPVKQASVVSFERREEESLGNVVVCVRCRISTSWEFRYFWTTFPILQ